MTRFLALLGSALSSGRCHVVELDGNNQRGKPGNDGKARAFGWKQAKDGSWDAQGALIGWAEGEAINLDSDAAYAVANEYARQQGGVIELTQRVLFERIHERGLLLETAIEGGKLRLNIKKRIAGGRPRVYVIKASAIVELDAPVYPRSIPESDLFDS